MVQQRFTRKQHHCTTNKATKTTSVSYQKTFTSKQHATCMSANLFPTTYIFITKNAISYFVTGVCHYVSFIPFCL